MLMNRFRLRGFAGAPGGAGKTRALAGSAVLWRQPLVLTAAA
jgi:hypothetical protein